MTAPSQRAPESSIDPLVLKRDAEVARNAARKFRIFALLLGIGALWRAVQLGLAFKAGIEPIALVGPVWSFLFATSFALLNWHWAAKLRAQSHVDPTR